MALSGWSGMRRTWKDSRPKEDPSFPSAGSWALGKGTGGWLAGPRLGLLCHDFLRDRAGALLIRNPSNSTHDTAWRRLFLASGITRMTAGIPRPSRTLWVYLMSSPFSSTYRHLFPIAIIISKHAGRKHGPPEHSDPPSRHIVWVRTMDVEGGSDMSWPSHTHTLPPYFYSRRLTFFDVLPFFFFVRRIPLTLFYFVSASPPLSTSVEELIHTHNHDTQPDQHVAEEQSLSPLRRLLSMSTLYHAQGTFSWDSHLLSREPKTFTRTRRMRRISIGARCTDQS